MIRLVKDYSLYKHDKATEQLFVCQGYIYMFKPINSLKTSINEF